MVGVLQLAGGPVSRPLLGFQKSAARESKMQRSSGLIRSCCVPPIRSAGGCRILVLSVSLHLFRPSELWPLAPVLQPVGGPVVIARQRVRGPSPAAVRLHGRLSSHQLLWPLGIPSLRMSVLSCGRCICDSWRGTKNARPFSDRP